MTKQEKEPCERCPDDVRGSCYYKNCPAYLAYQKRTGTGPGYGFYRGY